MSCVIETAQNGKINKVKDENGEPSKLFQQIFNVPILTLEQSLNIYKNTFSKKVGNDGKEEPELTFEISSGEKYTNYKEALQNATSGKIALKVNDVTIAQVDSDTNITTFNGALNHLTKHGVLSGEKILDVDGSQITKTSGDTDTAKQLTADIVEDIAVKLLGQSSVERTATGDFIFTDNLNKREINGEKVDEKAVNEMNYEQLKANFGEETAIAVEVEREYEKQLQPTDIKRRIDEDTDVKSEDELVTSIRSLLNELGIKITSIEDYEKNNALKNDVPANSSALMDVVNKIMAFRNGEITRDDLIEETMHLIEASLDPKTTENVRKVIHTTPEWKEHSQFYYDLYSKEYSGEKLEEMVRREILGKVMANGVATNFEVSQDATLTQQSIFDQIKNFLQDFFNKINAYFGDNTQSKIDQLNKDIFVKLLAGSLGGELNANQNFGTKFRLYSASKNISNDLVQIQQQAENALNVLKSQEYQLGRNSVAQKQRLKQAEESLSKVGEQFNVLEDSPSTVDKITAEKIAKNELVAVLSHVTNVAQKQLAYLQRAVKRSIGKNYHFSYEENAVYNEMLAKFDRYILPDIKSTLENQPNKTKAEVRLLEEIEKTISDLTTLKGQVANLEKKSKDVMVDLLVKRLDLSDEKRAFIEQKIDEQQKQVSWFFSQFGNIAQSSNVFLNAIGHAVSKTTQESREGTLSQVLPFVKKLKDSLYLSGAKVKEFAKDGYLVNRFDDKAREDAISQAKYDIYKDLSKDDISKEEYDKMTTFPKLTLEQSLEADQRYSDWYLDNIALSALSPQEMRERKKELETYPLSIQRYERNSSLAYFEIMQDAEVINGIPTFTEDMKHDFEDLKRDRAHDKSIYNLEGDKKDGIEYRTEEAYEESLNKENGQETDIIKVSNGLYASLIPGTTDNDSIKAFNLSKIDNNRVITLKASNGQQKEFTTEFIDILSSLDSKQAYDFLTLNAYVGYSNEYYDSFNKQSIIDKLKEELGGDNDYRIKNLIQNIAETTNKKNTILKAHREMNSPSEISYDSMEKSTEVRAIKEYEQDLENYYKEASAIIGKRGDEIEEDNLSETIPNKSFQAYMSDSEGVDQLVYNKDILDQNDINDIDKIFSAIIDHSTSNKKQEVLSLKSFVRDFSSGRENKIDKRYKKIFSKTEEEYRSMSEEQVFAMMTNEALQYSYTRLLPYFRKSQPKGVDKVLSDLEAGLIKSSEFINNYLKGDYADLNISPNYNFQKANELNNKNPHFAQARANGTPLFRTFELNTTENDVKTKSASQLKTEGKLNKFVNTEFLDSYNIDLLHLFKTGEEKVKEDTSDNISKKFNAREAFIDLQKQTLENYGKLNSHNIYKLPQKEKGKFRKFEDIVKSGKSVKELTDEFFNYREDESSLGQDVSGESYKKKNVVSQIIPKFGLRDIEDTSDELLETYTWMNKESNLYKARKHNIGDVLTIKDALLGSEFENNLNKLATTTYKMVDDALQHNYFGIRETFSKQFELFGIKGDLGKVLKGFGDFIRFRNLGYTIISPVTSALSGAVNNRIEAVVGESITRDSVNKARKLFYKYSGEAMREVMGFEAKSFINAVGNHFGFFENEERFNNSNYGKNVRFLGKSAFVAHQAFNFPVNPITGLSVLTDNKFVNGKLMQYRDFREQNKHKTEKEVQSVWKDYLDVTDVLVIKEDGVVTYDYAKISDAMNNGMSEAEAKAYMDDKTSLLASRIKIAIQRVDGQISPEDKSIAARNAIFSFTTLHKSWLYIATQNKLKGKQLNFSTGNMEEGSFVTTFRAVREVVNAVKSGKIYDIIPQLKEKWKNGSDTSRKNIKRTITEIGVLNALVALTVLAMKEGADDDDDSKLLQVASLFTYRLTNEVASSSVALPKNLYDNINNLVVGLSALDVAYDSPQLLSSDVIQRGRYKGLTERQKYLFKNMPLLRDAYNLGVDPEGTSKSYRYFTLDQGKVLNYMTIYPFISHDGKE